MHLTVFDSHKAEEIYKLKTYREECTSGKPKAIVALFHGLMSHCNRGVNLAKYFATRDITTVGFDYRGFGQSDGLRGYIDSSATHLNDCLKFMQQVRQVYPHQPIFGVGLSLGGATAYHLSLKHKELFTGTVLMAPALMPSAEDATSFGRKAVALNIMDWLVPSTFPAVKIDPMDNCRNPNYAEYSQNDEHYIKERVRFRTLVSLKDFLAYSRETFPTYDSPFMVVQGGCDKLIDPQVAFELYEQTATPEKDKEILFYDRMFHDVWHELEIDEIQEKVANWMLQRAR
jgi:acylglycerol lipase